MEIDDYEIIPPDEYFYEHDHWHDYFMQEQEIGAEYADESVEDRESGHEES